jgi:hypothetical protein
VPHAVNETHKPSDMLGLYPRSSEGERISLEREGDSFAGHWSVHRPPPPAPRAHPAAADTDSQGPMDHPSKTLTTNG